MRKRGISAIIATVLIILVTVAAVTIIWVAIIPMIQDKFGFDDPNARVDIVTLDGYTVYDDRGYFSVQLKRGADESDIRKVQILLNFNGTSEDHIKDAPEPNQMKIYCFDISQYGVPETVRAAPVFVKGGSWKQGMVTSKVDIPLGKFDDISGCDEVFGVGVCEDGASRSCGSPTGGCAAGTQSCVDGFWGDCGYPAGGAACTGGFSCDESAQCVECLGAGDCSDGDDCTVDSCSAGSCQNVVIGVCDCTEATVEEDCPDQACKDKACQSNACIYSNNDALSCSDGNICNGVETCSSGSCQDAVDLVCTDGDDCTQDKCNFLSGCYYTDFEPSGTSCPGGECNASGGCVSAPECVIDLDCGDDSLDDYCSDLQWTEKYVEHLCHLGECNELIINTTLKEDCNDQTSCTIDSCDDTEGCSTVDITTCGDDDGCCLPACSSSDDNNCIDAGITDYYNQFELDSYSGVPDGRQYASTGVDTTTILNIYSPNRFPCFFGNTNCVMLEEEQSSYGFSVIPNFGSVHTISFWFIGLTSDSERRFILGVGNGGDINTGEYFETEGNIIRVRNSRTDHTEEMISTTFNAMEWNHVVFVSGVYGKLYVNGDYITLTDFYPDYGSNPLPLHISNKEGMLLGEEVSNFKGAIDEIMIYHRELTPTQISELYVLDYSSF